MAIAGWRTPSYRHWPFGCGSTPASLLLIANRFTSAVPGCGVIDDGLGTDLALSCGRTVLTAWQVAAVEQVWQQAFDHAQFVWETPHSYRRLPLDSPALYTYFHRDFRLIQMDSFGDLLYKRVSGSVP